MEYGLENLLNSAPKQWISGPCGNGKLWLLIKKVQDIAEHTKDSVLVACFSKPLSMRLAKALSNEKVRVKTFEDLFRELCVCDFSPEQVEEAQVSEAMRRLEEGTVQVQRYHHIFVCECEDLEGDEWPTLFERLCKDEGREYKGKNHIWFLFDPNQNLSPRWMNHLESLEEGTRLPKVYRTTRNISSLAAKYFQAAVPGTESLKPGNTICGPRIEWDGALASRDDKEEAGPELLVKHIKDLRRNNVKDKEICILTESEQVRNSTISVLRKQGIESQNAIDLYKSGEDEVVVESVRQFKYCFSNVVVLYNPPYSENSAWTKTNVKLFLYLAVSSCVCQLVVITTECGCKALQSKEGMMTSY